MISYGLENEGEYSLAKRFKDDTIKLIKVDGMYEYFNPHRGKGPVDITSHGLLQFYSHLEEIVLI